MAKWIYDGDCMITSCCNIAYDIDKFESKGELIYVPCECPNCGADMQGDENSTQLVDKVCNKSGICVNKNPINLSDDEPIKG